MKNIEQFMTTESADQIYQDQIGGVEWPSYHPTVPRLYH